MIVTRDDQPMGDTRLCAARRLSCRGHAPDVPRNPVKTLTVDQAPPLPGVRALNTERSFGSASLIRWLIPPAVVYDAIFWTIAY